MDKCIGVDIGYGYTKTYTSEGKRSFPTAVTYLVPEATFSQIEPVYVNGEAFLAGDDALREGKGLISTRTAGFVMSKPWLAILGYALGVNNYACEDGTIVFGVPPGQFNRTMVWSIIDTVKKASVSYKGYNYSFTKMNIKVIPQGAGIFFAYMAGHSDDFERNIAVVDIGHYTIDMIFFSGGKYVEGATRSSHLGVSLILDEISRLFQRQHGLTIDINTAHRLLANGTVTILDQIYTVNNLREVVKSYARQVSSEINTYFHSLSVRPEIGLAGGGGINVLKGLVGLDYKLRIVDPPEFANAIGYWHYGKEYV